MPALKRRQETTLFASTPPSRKLLGLLAASALSISTTGCILAQDDVKENNKTSNASPNGLMNSSPNNSMNSSANQSSNAGANMSMNTSANNSSALSCDNACDKIRETCPLYFDTFEDDYEFTCGEVCNYGFDTEVLQCIVDAPTCAQIETCVEDVDLSNSDPRNTSPGNIEPGNFDPGNNSAACDGYLCVDPIDDALFCGDFEADPSDICASCGNPCGEGEYCGSPIDFDSTCADTPEDRCFAYGCNIIPCQFKADPASIPHSDCPDDANGAPYLVCHADTSGAQGAPGFCGAPCTADADCSGSTRCDAEEGRCVPEVTPSNNAPNDCTMSNDRCLCIGNDTNPQCFTRCGDNSACSAGEVCNTDLGICAPPCQTASQCRGTLFGTNATCEKPGDGEDAFCRRPCMGNNPLECPPAAVCSNEGYCSY